MRSRENSIRRMIAYSSVAQIGYIYMGFGLGTELGVLASVFHIICHAATKAILFLSASSLTEVSGDSTNFFDLTGAGYRDKVAGVAFTAGSLSMVGFPMLGGFISKILFAQAAVGHAYKMLPTLIALAISTILNTVYFLKTVIRIYTPMASGRKERERLQNGGDEGAAGESGGPYLLCCPESGARPVLTADSDAVRARTSMFA